MKAQAGSSGKRHGSVTRPRQPGPVKPKPRPRPGGPVKPKPVGPWR